jgi:hypothetical protein
MASAPLIMKSGGFKRPLLVVPAVAALLLAGTWSLVPLVQTTRPWSIVAARCLAVPYWTLSSLPAALVSAANFAAGDVFPAQRVPPPAAPFFESGADLRKEIRASVVVTVLGTLLYGALAVVLARHRKLRTLSLWALCAGWATTALLIVFTSGVALPPALRFAAYTLLRVPETILRAAGQLPPYSGPLNDPYPYPAVVDAVAVYTIVSAALWLAVILAGSAIAGALRRR